MTKFVALLLQVVLLGASCLPAHAQSDFLGDRFPYTAFDHLPATPINVGGGTLNVAFAPVEFALPRRVLFDWLETSAKAVSVYFGKFPVSSARILIIPVRGSGVQSGTTFGYRGAAIRLVVGRDVTAAELRDDWKAVHEMTHLALPDVHESHLWLAEGIAVYVEPIARVQAGDLTAEKIWGDMVRDMKQGLPHPGDHGLDLTPTWGRTYWGGAMFCLLADVDIRKRTGNRSGLQQALRGILAAGGNHEQEWPRSHLRRRRQGDRHHRARRSLRQDAQGAHRARSRCALARARHFRVRGQGDIRRKRAARGDPACHHRSSAGLGPAPRDQGLRNIFLAIFSAAARSASGMNGLLLQPGRDSDGPRSPGAQRVMGWAAISLSSRAASSSRVSPINTRFALGTA
jgi:hypothetical protein